MILGQCGPFVRGGGLGDVPILKTRLFDCLVSVITAAGWHTSIEPAYFRFCFFHSSTTICQRNCSPDKVCAHSVHLSYSPSYLHVPLCVFVDVQRCRIIPLTRLLSAELMRKGVKPRRCYTESLARQWVASEYLGCLTVPPPILSPQDCSVSQRTTTGLQGICKGSTPKSVTLRVMCVLVGV